MTILVYRIKMLQERKMNMAETKTVEKIEMPQINAQAAIVVTQNEGKILLEKNSRLKMYPAFLTKILASIIALEKCNLNDKVTISKTVIDEISKWKGSASINLVEGESFSVLDLIYSMMLVSANDSMFALAEYISGDKDKFTSLMEQKARSIGASETTITDEKGGFTAEQFSTAYDMAVICRYCMTNRTFRMIAATDKYTIAATNKSEERTIQNTNLLVNVQNRRYRYETAIGIKSGYTARSKSCLACSALPPKGKNGEEVIAIILGAENTKQMKYAFYDAITLFNFTFDNFDALNGATKTSESSSEQKTFLTVTEICDALHPAQRNAGECGITHATFGKNKVKPGCAYFAEDTESARATVEKGASLIICKTLVSGLPCIVVDDLEAAKASLARLIKTKLGMWTIGILDCPEKINPINMMEQLIARSMGVVKSGFVDDNYNGMLKAVLSAQADTEAAVINVSCNESGNVEKVAKVIGFDVAVFTSTVASKNPRNLNKEQFIEEKLKICKGMNESGAVIINIDDKNLAGIFSIGQDVITIGVDNKAADYYADNISLGRDTISFDIVTGTGSYHIELSMDDKHGVYQALACFALGEIMGYEPETIVEALQRFRKSSGLNVEKNENGTMLIYDFVNDTNESVSAGIKKLCLSKLEEGAKRIAVFADIGSEENHQREMYRKVGTLINKCPIDIAVCYGEIPKEIFKTVDLKQKFVLCLETPSALSEFLRLNTKSGDAVLLRGSPESGLDEVLENIR